MAENITIQIDSQPVLAVLRNLAQASHAMGPAFKAIANELRSITEERFSDQGPGWPALAASTIDQRAKHGHWPGQILQVSNALARSVSTDYGNDFADIGANEPYAAIQQLGGDAGRGHKSHIPPRPYLPVDESGALIGDAEQRVLQEVLNHLAKSAHP